MKNTKVYIALSSFAQTSSLPKELLEKSGLSFDVNLSGNRLNKKEVIERLEGYDGVIAGLEPYDAEVLNALPDLKCISRCGVGVDNIDLKATKAKGISVLNTPDAVIQPVAELTLAMILDLMRHVSVHRELMRHHQWEKRMGFQLAGKTIGIIGLGRIGQRVAELLVRLDCKVIATDIRPDHRWADAHRVPIVPLEELLSTSDVVTLHVTAVAGQAFQLKQKHFAMMKRGGFLVNTARGSLLDEQDLHMALMEGYLGGAALDVFDQEPYKGPLCDLPNVILTPHVATLTQESRLDMEISAVTGLIDHFKGRS